MKKIFTFLMAAAACISASATDLQLLFGDKDDLQVVDPAVTYQTGYEDEFGVIFFQEAKLFLKGLDGEDVTVVVHSTSANTQVCSLDGNCMMGADITKTANLGQASGVIGYVDNDEYVIVDLLIDKINYSVEEMEDITVDVTAYYNETPNDKVTAKVIMTNKPASEIGGVANLGADSYFIRAAAGNILNYRVERPTTISIYAITGNLVAKYPAANAGSINLSGLTRGIYLYTDGRRSGKITVR